MVTRELVVGVSPPLRPGEPQIAAKYFSQFQKIQAHQIIIRSKIEEASKLMRYQAQVKDLINSNALFQLYSNRVFQFALNQNNKEEIDAIEQINEKTAEIISKIAGRVFALSSDLYEYKTNVLEPIDGRIQKIKNAGGDKRQIKFWKFFKKHATNIIISFIFWVFQPPFNKSGLTQQDLNKTKQEIIDSIKSFQKGLNNTRIVSRNFGVRKSPKYSSPKIAFIKKGTHVFLINSNNKWINISFNDADGYPVTGWIPKKYLSNDYSRKRPYQ